MCAGRQIKWWAGMLCTMLCCDELAAESGHLGAAWYGWAGAGARPGRSGRLAGGFGLLQPMRRAVAGGRVVGSWVVGG